MAVPQKNVISTHSSPEQHQNIGCSLIEEYVITSLEQSRLQNQATILSDTSPKAFEEPVALSLPWSRSHSSSPTILIDTTCKYDIEMFNVHVKYILHM